ncbi:O-antigen ligase family protein [Streptacidiphilus jiangxiensis]|uniref:O-Antigen ligase n=1 Tax=Streptacidiphilus jiangxiensis TaxID=235985 RepID=A0A1H7VQN1_STRJI|nr:O-antigen ligase family protein [Streptacidiphilus jiangxiensis]SEM11583.1 O-Antigen ligase [Streptacidiphilus jiangxiensis]
MSPELGQQARPDGPGGPDRSERPGLRARGGPAALWWPRLRAGLSPAQLVALTVLLVCVPLGNQDVTAAVHVTPADVGSLALVAVTLPVALWRRTRFLARPTALLFAAVLLAVGVATAASQDPHESLSGFVRFVQIFVIVPAAVLHAVRDRRDLRLALTAFATAALVEGGVGVEQYVTGTGASFAGGDSRAVGTFGAQDVMAMSVVVSFGLLAALGLSLEARRERRRRAAAWWGLAAGSLAVPLALSFSRGSWIATAVAATLVLALTDIRLLLRGGVLVAATGVVLIGGLTAAGVLSSGSGDDGSVTARLSSIGQVTGAADHSVTDRYDLWTTAGRIWREHPLTGVGPKEFPYFRDAHAPLRLSSGSDTGGAGAGYSREPLLSPHNMYMLVLSEQGLIGITAFLALLLGTALGAWRTPVVVGLLVWQMVDFLYADIGGTTTVLISVVLGLCASALARGSLAAIPGPRSAQTLREASL